MSNRNEFTLKQRKEMAKNPYTFKVTKYQLQFTAEFKELFWAEYTAGSKPSQILRKYGYDPKQLGEVRVSGIQALIKKEAMRGKGFYSGKRPHLPDEENQETETETDRAIKQLQCEVKFLKQEIEFLKKIFSSVSTRK